MSKDGGAVSGMWFGELFQVGVYKRSQGRISRQVTFAVMAIVFALAAWRLYVTFGPRLSIGVAYSLAGVVLVAGLWFSFRIVNVPRFADFLIAVEAEMNKVSWPTRTELIRSSIVVLVTIFVLAFFLFGFDIFWSTWFQVLGILPVEEEISPYLEYGVYGVTALIGAGIVFLLLTRGQRQ